MRFLLIQNDSLYYYLRYSTTEELGEMTTAISAVIPPSASDFINQTYGPIDFSLIKSYNALYSYSPVEGVTEIVEYTAEFINSFFEDQTIWVGDIPVIRGQ